MASEKKLIYADELWIALEDTGADIFEGLAYGYSEFGFSWEALEKVLQDAPTVDAVEVVRCKDCKHSYDGVANIMCGRCGQNINGIRVGGVSVKEEHFCSYGERRNDG